MLARTSIDAGMSATEEIADFIVATGYDRLPQEAVDNAKAAVLDCLGCALAGSSESAVRIVTRYVRDMGSNQEAGVIVAGFQTSAPYAALANGTMAHALDFDDVAVSWVGHPTSVVLPAALALGQRQRLSGKKVILAYILGLEIEAKLGGCVGSAHYDWGWHATATVGAMGAAAAGAKLLGLDARQTRMALGIAVSLAGGTRQNFGTMTKAFHAGSAARNGVEAALLAQQGFTAAESIIESPMGFCHLFSGGGSYDSRHASQGLGDPFDVVSPGLSLKPYPCCRFTHRCIDATLYLKKKYGLTADNVAEVQCFTAASLPQILIYSEPKNGLEGKFSMQYCLAAALLDGQVTLASFSDDRVREAKAQELLRRVKYVFTSNATGAEALAAPEKVTIRLRDGRKLSHEVLVPRGDPRNPMTEEERVAKYEDCAGVVLSTEAIKKSRDMVLYLDEIEDISELMGLLCFTRKGVV